MTLPAEEYKMLQNKAKHQHEQAVNNFSFSSVQPYAFEVAHRNHKSSKADPKVKPKLPKLPLKPEYSNPAIRQEFAYKPPLSGKAAEVLGVKNVKDFKKPPELPEQAVFTKAANVRDMSYPEQRIRRPPVSRFSWDSNKATKKSENCIVM
jgi:hypothetical protein